MLRAEPDWDALPVAEAPGLCRLIERCLERDPKQRLRDIGEARILLHDGGAQRIPPGLLAAGPGRRPRPAPARGGPAARAPAAGWRLVCLAAGALLGWKLLARPTPPPVLHAMLPPPARTDYDLNPNGAGAGGHLARRIDGGLHGHRHPGVTRLYLRHLDQGESVAMSGTEDAAYPFWSADDR